MSLSTRKKSNINRKKVLILSLAAGLIIIAGIIVFFLFFNKSAPQQQQATNPVNTTNLDPPTTEEQQEAEQNKIEVTKDQQKETETTPKPQPGQKIDAKPFIVYVGQNGDAIELNGYTSAVFEDGGTCTATFTKDSLKVVRESKGFADARHTTCPPMSVPRNEFAQSGDWKATLSYSSSTATGTSSEATLNIQ
jgi:cytoskeletal protein RodZ